MILMLAIISVILHVLSPIHGRSSVRLGGGEAGGATVLTGHRERTGWLMIAAGEAAG